MTFARDEKIRFLLEQRFGDLSRLQPELDRAIEMRREPRDALVEALMSKKYPKSFREETISQVSQLYHQLLDRSEEALDALLPPPPPPQPEGLLGFLPPLEVRTEEAQSAFKPPVESGQEEVVDFHHLRFDQTRIGYWVRMPVWTVREAVAISLGNEPGLVESFDDRRGNYARRNELITRAISAGELESPLTPFAFLAWAERWDLALGEGLMAELRRLRDHQRSIDTMEPTQAPDSLEIKEPTTKPLGVRERETLLKLAVGMAIGGYSWKPDAKRSDAVTDIVNDLNAVGLGLSDDTVRSKLREGAELLSGNVRTSLRA